MENPNPIKPKKADHFGIVEFGKSLLFSIIFVVVFTTFIAKPIRVNGSSMYPTLIDRELGFSNVLTLKLSGIQRFDVVIVYVDQLKEYLVKRVIALPGETVEYKHETLYIDNKPLDQTFLDAAYVAQIKKSTNTDFTNSFGPYTVKPGEVWLMGDNRPFSSDSRRFGAFPINKIVSKDAYILFPLNQIRIVTQ
jgi:signal peptidase I